MAFKPGQSGNRNGRPPGSRNCSKIYEEAIAGHQDALIQKGIAMAKAGDPHMLRLFLERILPAKPRDKALPPITIDEASLGSMAESVTQAVCASEITPVEGINMINLIKAKSELIDIVDLKNEIEELKTSLQQMQNGNIRHS